MDTMTTSPRIYVADLAAYNAGYLHGIWIDLEGLTVEDVNEQVQAMLAEGTQRFGLETLSVHEEWAIHDYEGFGNYRVGEWSDFGTLVEIANAYEAASDLEAFKAWLSDDSTRTDDIADSVERFNEAFIGQMSALDYAYDYIESTGELDENSTLARYFDYEAFARDMILGGDVTEIDGYLFHGNI